MSPRSQRVYCPHCLHQFTWPDEVPYYVAEKEDDDVASGGNYFLEPDEVLRRTSTGLMQDLVAFKRLGARPVCPESPRYVTWREDQRPAASAAPPPPPPPPDVDPDAATRPDLGAEPATDLLPIALGSGYPPEEREAVSQTRILGNDPSVREAEPATAAGSREDDGAPSGSATSVPHQALFRTDLSDRVRGLHELPERYGEHPLVIVALVGTATTGKSHFYASLVGELDREGDSLRRLGFAFEPGFGSFRKTFEAFEATDFLDPPHRELPPTVQGQARMLLLRMTVTMPAEHDQTRPAAQMLSALRGTRRQQPDDKAFVNVLLVDLPGEAFQDEGDMLDFSPVALVADAVIYLEDLLLSERLRREVRPFDDEDAPRRHRVRAKGIMQRMNDLADAGDGRPPSHDKIGALVFTKSDQIDTLRQRFAGLVIADRLLGTHPLALDEVSIRGASADVYALLHAFGGHDPARWLFERYGAASLHLVSATGCDAAVDPTGESMIFPRYRPRNVLQPLLTVVWQWATRDREGAS